MVREINTLAWYFDGNMIHKLNMDNLNKTIARELKQDMLLHINLIVGGPKLVKKWSEEDVTTWKCPSLIVDYVRVYADDGIVGHKHGDYNESNLKTSEYTPGEICSTVQTLSKINISTSTGLYYLLGYVLVAFLLIMFIVLGILFWKLKKRFENNKKSNEQDDIDNQKEIDLENDYDQILYGDENVYENIQDDIDQDYLEIYDRISMDTLNQGYQEMNYEKLYKEN